MLQQDEPEDFVIATGEQHSVREFVSKAGARLGMDIEWTGEGMKEIGTDAADGRVVVKIDPRYFRPTEVDTLLGDSTKAREKLGWSPKVSFEALVEEMVDSDLELAKRDALIMKEGFKVYQHHE